MTNSLIIIGIAAAIQCHAMDGEKAVEAIIGESAGQTYTEKLAIAGALRNRGTLDGVRGFKNQRMIHTQPARVWTDARTAWAQSTTNDITRGATFWESTNFPRPEWSKDMTITARIGKFIFYRE